MADPKVGFFDEAFEQGIKTVKAVGKQLNVTPGSAAKAVGGQVVPAMTPTSKPSAQGEEKAEDSPDNKKNQKQTKPISPPKNTNQILRGQFIKPKPEQIVKEQQDLQKVRNELHQKYYQDLVDRPKHNDEPVAEKLEREEKEEEQKEFIAEQKKQEANAALQNVRQGTGEKITGIGG